jgi:hypothetical protein
MNAGTPESSRGARYQGMVAVGCGRIKPQSSHASLLTAEFYFLVLRF